MSRRYTDLQLQSAGSSSLSPASRMSYNNDGLPLRSEAIHDHPWQHTINTGYTQCNICPRNYCSCTVSRETVTTEEDINTPMSGDGMAMIQRRPPLQLEGLEDQRADHGFGDGYGMTGRQSDYEQDANRFAAQAVYSQKCYNTARNYHLSQTTRWSPYDGSSSSPRNFDASTDRSDFVPTQSDHNTIDEPYEYGDEDNDDNDESELLESNEPSQGTTLSDLEGLYKPSQCLLPGCKGEYLFATFQAYRSHIHNVHEKAIWCPIPHCKHDRPFANKSDVDRHYRSKHGDKSKKPFKCLRDVCTARAKAFNRKDKLREHDIKYHTEYYCFICPRPRWFETFEECAEHTNAAHVYHG